MRKSNIFICTSYLIVTRKAQFYQRGRLSRLYSRTRETAAITKDPQIKWLKISLILTHLLCSQKADRRAFLHSIVVHTLRLKVIENLLSEQWWLLGQRERRVMKHDYALKLCSEVTHNTFLNLMAEASHAELHVGRKYNPLCTENGED